jgi:hypothetical protein
MAEMQIINKRENLLDHQESSVYHNGRPQSQTFKEFFDYIQKQKPQTNAIMMGCLAVVNGGMQFSWGVFNHRTVADRKEDMELCIIISAWFLSAVVGLFLLFSSTNNQK